LATRQKLRAASRDTKHQFGMLLNSGFLTTGALLCRDWRIRISRIDRDDRRILALAA
jgi:hypothetical protein